MKILIMGCGNILAGDDGAGVWAARALQAERLPRQAEVMEAGTPGHTLVDYLPGYDEVYIIDVILGDSPGRVKALPWQELPPLDAPAWHIHGAGLRESLALAKRHLGALFPAKIKIVTIEILPPDRWHEGLSAPVAAALPEVVNLIREDMESA